jgi:hypothetical protein
MITITNIEDRSSSRFVVGMHRNNKTASAKGRNLIFDFLLCLHPGTPGLIFNFSNWPIGQFEFYAKQTQFAECSNKRKSCPNNDLSKYPTFQTPAKTNPISTPPPPIRPADYKYAKQTQFAGYPNKRKYRPDNGLSKYPTFRTPEKQTQFQELRNPTKPRKKPPLFLIVSHIFARLEPLFPPKTSQTSTFRSK